jgi:hypothetical protein
VVSKRQGVTAFDVMIVTFLVDWLVCRLLGWLGPTPCGVGPLGL